MTFCVALFGRLYLHHAVWCGEFPGVNGAISIQFISFASLAAPRKFVILIMLFIPWLFPNTLIEKKISEVEKKILTKKAVMLEAFL
jgi:hypothetical protein